MRPWIAAAVAAGAGLLAAVGLAAYLLRRRRRPIAELPPPAAMQDPVADEPMSRETRYDEEIDAEQRRRHEAAERLRSDPFNDRLENDAES